MINATFLNIFKLFLPSWNFFNDFSTTIRLEHRIGQNGKDAVWQSSTSPASSHLGLRIFFNPRGNLALTQQSCVERAAEWFESNKSGDERQFEKTHHHQILAVIVRDRIGTANADSTFQFRLIETQPRGQFTTLFESRSMTAEESR